MPAESTLPMDQPPAPPQGVGLASSTPGSGASPGESGDGESIVGKSLDGYQVVRRIGRGGMGEVFLAEHTVLGRKTALKVLPGGWLVTPDRVERFHREARLAAQLDHPNIVRVLHAGSQGELHFLVLEYVEGESLGDRLERTGKLPLDEALGLIEQAAHGLDAAHGRGIIHRDIKPGNLLVALDGTLKVADFGLARELLAPSDLTGSNQVLGTPSFMAPEQVEARPLDARTDLFSLGATLYCLITGKLPFRGDTAMAILYQIVHEAPRPLSETCPGTPPAVERLVSSLLEKSPDRRPASAELVASAIAAVRKGLGARAPGKTAVAPLAAAGAQPTNAARKTGVAPKPAASPSQTGPTVPAMGRPKTAVAPRPAAPMRAVAPPKVAASAPAARSPWSRGRVIGLAVGALVLGAIGAWSWGRWDGNKEVTPSPSTAQAPPQHGEQPVQPKEPVPSPTQDPPKVADVPPPKEPVPHTEPEPTPPTGTPEPPVPPPDEPVAEGPKEPAPAEPAPEEPPSQEPAPAEARGTARLLTATQWPTGWVSIYSKRAEGWLRATLPGGGWSADRSGATLERGATPLETQVREEGFLAEVEFRVLEGTPRVELNFGHREARYIVRWEEGKSLAWERDGADVETLYEGTPQAVCAGKETQRVRLLYQVTGTVAFEVNGKVLLQASDPSPIPAERSGLFLSFPETRALLVALEIVAPTRGGRPPK